MVVHMTIMKTRIANKLTLRLPQSLHEKLKELAKADDVSINQFAVKQHQTQHLPIIAKAHRFNYGLFY